MMEAELRTLQARLEALPRLVEEETARAAEELDALLGLFDQLYAQHPEADRKSVV